MGKVIGVCGFIGSGKGTVSDILVEKYGFEKLSFAERLKDAAAVMFGWPRDLLEGDTIESRTWREQTDTFWSSELAENITPRLVLQLMGTDCMRKGFADDIWLLIVKQKILNNPDKDFVITDVRFYNERDMILELGGDMWRVVRGAAPVWVDYAIHDNHHGTDYMKTHHPEIHESEWRWIDEDSAYTRIIDNNHTRKKLNKLV